MRRRKSPTTFLAEAEGQPVRHDRPDRTAEHSEPMTAQIDDDQPNTLFFFAGKDNRIAKRRRGDGAVRRQGARLLRLPRRARSRRTTTRRTIDKLWNNQVEAWFPNGKADPTALHPLRHRQPPSCGRPTSRCRGRLKMLFGGTIKPSESSQPRGGRLGRLNAADATAPRRTTGGVAVQAFAAIHSSTTGAIWSRHFEPLKMP